MTELRVENKVLFNGNKFILKEMEVTRGVMVLFTNPSARAGYDTMSTF